MSTFFLDPAIGRKSGIVDDSLRVVDGVPLPSVVEVSESGTCNRVCAFCPRSGPDFKDVKEFIAPALIDKLAGELATYDYSGIFLFSGFVEPMLDRNIFDLVARVRGHLPLAKIEMVTNGDVLTPARVARLFESGLSAMLISVYDSKEDADRLEGMCREAGLLPGQYVIRHRYLPEEENFGITLSNRAGMMDGAAYQIASLSEPLAVPCYYPHYTFFMDYLGDVLLCPHDWGKKQIVGNMVSRSFMEIWAGAAFAEARRALAQGDRSVLPCSVCDVKGTLMGRAHVDCWSKRDGGGGA